MQAVEESNDNAPGGFTDDHGNQYVIKGEGRVHNVSEIEDDNELIREFKIDNSLQSLTPVRE